MTLDYVNLPGGTLYRGDALELMADMPDACVDLIVTDPPYKVISGGIGDGSASGFSRSVLAANDGKIFAHNDLMPADYMAAFYRVLKPGTHCYVMINNLNLEALLTAGRLAGFRFHNLLGWRKNTVTANRWYMKEAEPVLLFYKPPAKRINDCGSKQLFECDNPTGADKLHPTMKPVELMEHYVLNSSQPGDLVLDPFAGCGSTALACQKSGRRWITCDMDPQWAEVALGRLR